MKILAFLILSAGIVSCSLNQKDDLDREVALQPVRPMHGGVAAKGLEAIDSSALSASQKAKLKEIHSRMVAETFENQEQTSRLKAVLFETITKQPYDAKKIDAIKKRLLVLNDDKINGMFRALNEVEKVLGQAKPDQKQDIFEGLFFKDEGPPSKQ